MDSNEKIGKYYEKNKEKMREYHRRYRDRNKEKIAEANKRYREENKEKLREYYRRYRKSNKEKRDKRGGTTGDTRNTYLATTSSMRLTIRSGAMPAIQAKSPRRQGVLP